MSMETGGTDLVYRWYMQEKAQLVEKQGRNRIIGKIMQGQFGDAFPIVQTVAVFCRD